MSRAMLAVAVGLTALACGGTRPAGAPVSSGTEPVVLSVTHRSEWRVLWVEGETDLPDGATIDYRVTHEQARQLATEDWPAANLIENGRATVLDGQYWTRVNTLRWPAGQVEILVQFPVSPQPPEIAARYGALGEELTGDNVTELSGLKVAEATHVFDHRP